MRSDSPAGEFPHFMNKMRGMGFLGSKETNSLFFVSFFFRSFSFFARKKKLEPMQPLGHRVLSPAHLTRLCHPRKRDVIRAKGFKKASGQKNVGGPVVESFCRQQNSSAKPPMVRRHPDKTFLGPDSFFREGEGIGNPASGF
jgi:hypothetical protein